MTPAVAKLPRVLRSYSTTTVASVTVASGRTTLGEVASIPANELWLFLNSCAREDLAVGIEQATAGRITPVESFAEFADIELDD